jgi:penicillin V acylase-like amidase (Ntn superfamily)
LCSYRKDGFYHPTLINKTRTLPLVFALTAVVLPPCAPACSVLLFTDANGLPYFGRTLEFVGNVPNRMTYYPAGSRFESATPDSRPGIRWDSKHGALKAAKEVTFDAINANTNPKATGLFLN